MWCIFPFYNNKFATNTSSFNVAYVKFKAYGDKTLLNKSLRLETGKQCNTRKLTQNQQYIGLINIIKKVNSKLQTATYS